MLEGGRRLDRSFDRPIQGAIREESCPYPAVKDLEERKSGANEDRRSDAALNSAAFLSFMSENEVKMIPSARPIYEGTVWISPCHNLRPRLKCK